MKPKRDYIMEIRQLLGRNVLPGWIGGTLPLAIVVALLILTAVLISVISTYGTGGSEPTRAAIIGVIVSFGLLIFVFGGAEVLAAFFAILSFPFIVFGSAITQFSYGGRQQDILNYVNLLMRQEVPLTDGLREYAKLHPNLRVRATVRMIVRQLERGRGLSEVHLFSRGRLWFCGELLRFGEEFNCLPAAIWHAEDYISAESRTIHFIEKTATYMTMLLLIPLPIAAFIFSTTIPKFAEVFAGMGVRLPVFTQIVITVANSVAPMPLFLATATLILLYAGIRQQWLARASARSPLLAWIALKMPVMGRLTKHRSRIHVAMILALSSKCNTPLAEALRSASQLRLNALYRVALYRLAKQVENGTSLGAAMKSDSRMRWLFDDAFRTYITLGERNGRFADSCEALVCFNRARHSLLSYRIRAVLQPMTVVLVGLFVLSITYSIYGTLAQLASDLSLPE